MHRVLPALLCTAPLLACSTQSSEAPGSDAPDATASHDRDDGGHGHGGATHGHGHHGGGDHGDNGHGYKGHRFEDPQDWVDHFESPEREAWQKPDAVVAKLAPARDAKIADLGAGTGYFAVRFAAAAPAGQVFAVDIEPGMVEYIDARAERDGLTNLAAHLGQPDGPALPEPVDLAFMCDVFHHLADPQAYFEAVAGSLREGGRVAIVDFRKQLPDDAPGPPEAMRMSADAIVEIMEAAGYALVGRELELLEYQYLLVFERA